MSSPEIFTQTPLEAGIWTAAVGAQTVIAKTIAAGSACSCEKDCNHCLWHN